MAGDGATDDGRLVGTVDRRLRAMAAKKKPALRVTGDPEADALLVDDPLALLLGMLLDQHMR